MTAESEFSLTTMRNLSIVIHLSLRRAGKYSNDICMTYHMYLTFPAHSFSCLILSNNADFDFPEVILSCLQEPTKNDMEK